MESVSDNTNLKTDQNIDSDSMKKNGSANHSRKLILAILVCGIIAGSFYGIRWLHYYFTHAGTDDARIQGDLISISSTVSGKIRLLPIHEGQKIKKGQLIAQLREEDYQARVDETAGAVQAIGSSLDEAKTGLALTIEKTGKLVQQAEAVLSASRAQLNEAKANLRLTELDFKRSNNLYKKKTISTSEIDKSRAAYELAQARMALADEEIRENQVRLKVAKANLGEVKIKQHQVEYLRGKLKEAESTLALAKLKLAHTTVTSPIEGIVAKKIAHPGEVIKAGQPVAVIIDLNHIWVEANLEETKVEHVRMGQNVDLSVDAYPDTKFTGKVVNIGAVAASEFALIPENSSAGSFTKVTQRIPIKIEVLDPAQQLRPGMMVVVGIDIRNKKYK